MVFVSQSLNILIFRFARPEALSALFLHLIFFFFLRNLHNLETLKNNIYDLFFLSLSIFLALFTHLNDIFPSIICVLILFYFSYYKNKNITFILRLSFFLVFFGFIFLLLLYLLKGLTIFEYRDLIFFRVVSEKNKNIINAIVYFKKYNYDFLRFPIWFTEIFSIIFLFYSFKKVTLYHYFWTISPIVILILSLIFFNQFSIRHFTVFYIFIYFALINLIYQTILKPNFLKLIIIILFFLNSFGITFMFFYKDRNNICYEKVEEKFVDIQDKFNNKIIAGNLAQLHLIDNYKEFFPLSHSPYAKLR